MDIQSTLLDVLVELEDIGRRVRTLRDVVAADIADSPWTRADFSENTTNSEVCGTPCASEFTLGREAPNDDGVAPGYETLTHTVAIDDDLVQRIDKCGE